MTVVLARATYDGKSGALLRVEPTPRAAAKGLTPDALRQWLRGEAPDGIRMTLADGTPIDKVMAEVVEIRGRRLVRVLPPRLTATTVVKVRGAPPSTVTH